MAREDTIASFRELISIIKELLETGDWEASLFLRTAQKKLQNIIEESIALIGELEKEAVESAEEIKEKSGFIEVFVSVYQADPNNLVKWQNTLAGITELSISRPIYRSEDHIQSVIRAKNSPNEAYAIVMVKASDIIPTYAGKPIEDRYGYELLTLREGSIRAGNIVEFIHQDKRYIYKDGKLLVKPGVR